MSCYHDRTSIRAGFSTNISSRIVSLRESVDEIAIDAYAIADAIASAMVRHNAVTPTATPDRNGSIIGGRPKRREAINGRPARIENPIVHIDLPFPTAAPAAEAPSWGCQPVEHMND